MAPLERFFRLPQERREQLLEAARAEFVAHGFERASYNRIITAAEVSKGAMYYYFADKADLFAAVIEDQLQRLLEQVGEMRQPVDAADYWDAILEWGAAATAAALQEPELAVLGRCLYSESSVQGALTQLRARVHAAVVEALRLGQSLGAVRSDLPNDLLATSLTHLLLGIDQWFTEQMGSMTAAELRQMSHKAFELCRDLVVPPPPRGEKRS